MNESERSADERIARIYRDAAREEPPAHLDHAIRRGAREAGTARPRVQRWWTSWRLPVALAAVGIISVSLVTLMLEEGGGRLTEIPQGPTTARPEASARPETTSPGASSSPAQDRVRADSPAPGPVAEPGARREKARAQDQIEARAREDAGAQRRHGIEDASPTQPRAPGVAAATAGDAEEPRKASPAVTEPSAPPASPGAGAASERSARPAAKPAAAPQAAASRREYEDRRAAEIARLEAQPPEVWLERISRLRSEGRDREADALLIELRARFPEAVEPLSTQ